MNPNNDIIKNSFSDFDNTKEPFCSRLSANLRDGFHEKKGSRRRFENS